ncbi:twenty-four isoform 1-T4 [Cochliomyia hominivorax]
MNNESIKSPKIITSVSNSTSTHNINSTSSSTTSTSTSFSSISSSSLSSTTPLLSPFSNSSQFDVTVSAIAAVVNASNHLPVTTPPNAAAAVVAVAVSSLAAAIIPDTPIVSIAGSTLSEITTTTTSTKTTPTPVPTSKETENRNNNNISNNNTLNCNSNNKNSNNKNIEQTNRTPPSPSTSSVAVNTSLSTYSTSKASAKSSNQMSVANSSATGALTNASTTAANAAAADIENNTKQAKDNSSCSTAKESSSTINDTAVIKTDSLSTATPITETKSIISTSLPSQTVVNATASTNKTDDINVTPNETKSKDFLSESWEESRLKDWDDSKLKELLDEAYSYKNPRDKENKSKTFLKLLEKAENEDQSYPFRVTSYGSRNLSSSITSNNYHHYQQSPHYNSHSHNHNRSHHHHKQGGSLQDLFEIGLHESQLDCDQTFGIGISGNQRTRRQNHNSRQKKYSSSVSSRQREGGSLPSNVNVTHQLGVGVSGGVVNDLSSMQQESSTVTGVTSGTLTSTNISKTNKKEQRRNASKVPSTAMSSSTELKELNTPNCVGESVTCSENKTTSTNSTTYTASGGDFIIDMDEPIIDIQQQRKILQCKGQDAAQDQPFFEKIVNTDKRLPRANITSSTKGTYFAPTTSHCYVDESVRFNALERNVGTNSAATTSTVDAKFLPLDENYKSCKSVLGSDGDKSPEMLAKSKSNTIYTKISSPASGPAVLTGTTNNIATLTQRQLDENGNALSELYQNSSGVGSGSGATLQINAVSPTAANASTALLNSCGNVSTSATVTISPHTSSTTVSTSATVTTTFTSGPSQAKAKAKKKSQQERNTKTVDVESVAGYRGKDPVEELVKYIESSGEDKQVGSKSGDKKKERKKEKEKHQKLKKSNSLEELRSGAKMEVHELKRTAATTESNAVLVRQKSGGGGGGKQNKNSSSSTADINKNVEGKSATQTTNSRKSDRRSWGNEDLKYLEDQQNANLNSNEDKTNIATTNSAKERKNKVSSSGGGGTLSGTTSKDDKEIKDKTSERNERNLINNVSPTTPALQIEKLDKMEKTEKIDKSEKSENKLDKNEKRKKHEIPANAVTVVDILAIESVLPETAEFHVVTKKKKPKKPKVINNLEETTVTFNRTHNFTMQKTSTFNQQQQQMTVRYKYYHHDNSSSNTGISNTNSQNYQQSSSQQQQTQQSCNFNSNSHQNQNQQHPHNSVNETYTNTTATTTTTTTTDKSRRKSTSSVPPSEKSDSSDLDSVHSLPIESTKANANANATTTSSTTKGVNTQQRLKGTKNNNNVILGNNNPTLLCKNQNSPAPISYADIARTNKEIADAAAASASGILINNNEISIECRNSDATVHNTVTTIDSTIIDDKPLANLNPTTTITPATTSITNATTIKSHKIKKSQIKQDFPELAGTSVGFSDDKSPSTNVNHKTITYSQSLTAVTNPTQHTFSTQSHGSGGSVGGGFSSASDSSPSSSSDVTTKASPTENLKHLIVHQNVNIPPLQHPQQQILQKSKSVDNDSVTTSTNVLSSSSASYMASLNSNNLDQQYPALEKTVKRHSSSSVTASGLAINTSNQTPFNFAAAAKQQITNISEQQHHYINSNKNSALSTSNTNNTNNTIQSTALLHSSNSNTSISNYSGNSGLGSSTNNLNKKSKEKTPPLSSTNNVTIVTAAAATVHPINPDNNANPKKSKKERHQHHTSAVESSQSKQNQNSNKKPLKTQLKSSNSLPLGLTSSTFGGVGGTSSTNRPAVIILNDDRSCSADNQFTFGDFNEEELKLFDDDNITSTVAPENLIDNINIHANQTEEEEKHVNTDVTMKSPSTMYFNDSGASCGNDMVNNSTSDMLLSSSIEASSPNTSFVANSHGSNGGGALHMPVLSNNQSSDSGIYTDKTKSSNSSCSSSSSCSSGGATSNNTASAKQKQKQQMSPTKEENNKLNTFLSNTRCASVHTSMDNLDPPLPPPQQLETCNDIETAIIAAARAAAKNNNQQPSHNQQHQHQYKNSNTSSNSSSFSSSSLSSTSSAVYHQQHQQQNYHQQHHNSNINNSNKNYQHQQHGGSGKIITSYRQSQHQNVDDYDDNESFVNTPRSRSPSRPRRISIACGTVANKEFDIHFIPPTTMPSAFSMQHHNDIIIDFISSAWEEVANSKVTKVYDGQ